MAPAERDEDDVAVAGERVGQGDVESLELACGEGREYSVCSHRGQVRAPLPHER